MKRFRSNSAIYQRDTKSLRNYGMKSLENS